MKRSQDSWLHLVREVVSRMPGRFSNADVYGHEHLFHRAYPTNKNIKPKIRQKLQELVAEGFIERIREGSYCRKKRRNAPTLVIDFGNVAKGVEMADEALEIWAKFNLWCHNCENPNLVMQRRNYQVSDLYCAACKMEYQVKSTKFRFARTIRGAGHLPLSKREAENDIPDYLLIEYNMRARHVVKVSLIRGIDLVGRITPRTLGAGARRAGYVLSDINIDGLDSEPIVGPSFLPRFEPS